VAPATARSPSPGPSPHPPRRGLPPGGLRSELVPRVRFRAAGAVVRRGDRSGRRAAPRVRPPGGVLHWPSDRRDLRRPHGPVRAARPGPPRPPGSRARLVGIRAVAGLGGGRAPRSRAWARRRGRARPWSRRRRRGGHQGGGDGPGVGRRRPVRAARRGDRGGAAVSGYLSELGGVPPPVPRVFVARAAASAVVRGTARAGRGTRDLRTVVSARAWVRSRATARGGPPCSTARRIGTPVMWWPHRQPDGPPDGGDRRPRAGRLGYRPDEVHWYSYADDGGRYGPRDTERHLPDAAVALGEQLRSLQRARPGREVDLLAHSQGGVVVDLFLAEVYSADDPTFPPLGTVVTLASPHRGAPVATAVDRIRSTESGRAALGALSRRAGALPDPSSPAVADLSERSPVVRALAAADLPEHLDVTSISAPDDVIVPATVTGFPGGTAVTVDPAGFDDHSNITRDTSRSPPPSRARRAATPLRGRGRGRPPWRSSPWSSRGSSAPSGSPVRRPVRSPTTSAAWRRADDHRERLPPRRPGPTERRQVRRPRRRSPCPRPPAGPVTAPVDAAPACPAVVATALVADRRCAGPRRGHGSRPRHRPPRGRHAARPSTRVRCPCAGRRP